MLKEILNTLRQHQGMDLKESTLDVGINDTLASDSYEQRIITMIAYSPKVSVADMAERCLAFPIDSVRKSLLR